MTHSFRLNRLLQALQDIHGAQHVLSDFSEQHQFPFKRQLKEQESALPLALIHPVSTAALGVTMGLLQNANLKAWIHTSAQSETFVPPQEPYVVIDLQSLREIVEIDQVSHTVTVETGATAEQIEQKLNDLGFSLGYRPAIERNPSIATILSRADWGHQPGRAVMLGDRLLSMTFVLPDGNVFSTPVTPRSAAGPNLNKLFVGDHSQLGIVTVVVLPVFPLPPRRILRSFTFSSLDNALEVSRILIQSRIEPTELFVFENDSWGIRLVLAYEGFESIIEPVEAWATACVIEHEGNPLEAEVTRSVFSSLPMNLYPQSYPVHVSFRVDWSALAVASRLAKECFSDCKRRWLYSGMDKQQVNLHIYCSQNECDALDAAIRLRQTLITSGIQFQMRCSGLKSSTGHIEQVLLSEIKPLLDKHGILL